MQGLVIISDVWCISNPKFLHRFPTSSPLPIAFSLIRPRTGILTLIKPALKITKIFDGMDKKSMPHQGIHIVMVIGMIVCRVGVDGSKIMIWFYKVHFIEGLECESGDGTITMILYMIGKGMFKS